MLECLLLGAVLHKSDIFINDLRSIIDQACIPPWASNKDPQVVNALTSYQRLFSRGIYIILYIPRTCMTSILDHKSPQRWSNFLSKQRSCPGFRYLKPGSGSFFHMFPVVAGSPNRIPHHSSLTGRAKITRSRSPQLKHGTTLEIEAKSSWAE